MFKEHFQDDRPALQPDRTGYLHNMSAFHANLDVQDPANVPAFAKKLPMALPQSDLDFKHTLLSKGKDNLHSVPPAEPSPPPPTPPPKRTPSPKFEPPPPAALPKHMTSTSSRFSFQIGGSGSSAQEKLLEEKHKQHAANQKASSKDIEEEDDEYTNYDFDADDGLEEEIPSFNADLYGKDDGFDSNIVSGNALVAKYGPTNNGGFGSGNQQGNPLVPKYALEDDGFGSNPVVSNALVPKYAPVDDGEFDIDPPTTHYNALEPKYPPPDAPLPEIPQIKTTTLHRQSLQGFHFTPQSLTFSPTSPNNGSQPTPRDHEGFAIGIADSRDFSATEHSNVDHKDEELDMGKLSLMGGLGISAGEVVRGRRRSQQVIRPHAQVFDDEDLYFDDGEFGDLDAPPTNTAFDEQIFDDETGKIRDIPAENARRLEAAKAGGALDGQFQPVTQVANPPESFQNEQEHHRRDSEVEDLSKPRQVSQSSFGHGSVAGLTETNLAAYHDALAFAANQAAANGRFDRKVSFSQASDDTSPSYGNSHQGIISDDSRFGFNYRSGIAEDDGFPFDDDLEDDPMIAEANAEALENDEDGFYGQEFGFYAHSYAKGNAELVNGGYFAERGSNGVKRSHSGKANFQEPSLTPITERSEWSTRNSVVSLQMPGGIPASAQSMPSPGIAQLLELDSPGYDDDMTFTALMRLRGRAFGANSSNANSSGGSHTVTSPLAHVSHHPFSHSEFNSARMSSTMHGQHSPAVGIPESEEEDDDEGDRPTLTQNTPRKKSTEPSMYTSQEEMPSSPGAGADRRKGHHSRTSSGADSVSYQRDVDGRWVLERRRTDEEGGNELIDREYLAGDRI